MHASHVLWECSKHDWFMINIWVWVCVSCVHARVFVSVCACAIALVLFSAVAGNIPQMTVTQTEVVGEGNCGATESFFPERRVLCTWIILKTLQECHFSKEKKPSSFAERSKLPYSASSPCTVIEDTSSIRSRRRCSFDVTLYNERVKLHSISREVAVL